MASLAHQTRRVLNNFVSENLLGTAQTPLALADIPFVYSMTNIIFIWYRGELQDFSQLLPVALFAGIVGTFVVTIHPIQRLLDRVWKRNINQLNLYGKYKIFHSKNTVPADKTINIEKSTLNLALKTAGIKYEKDKIVASFYFIIILGTISTALLQPNFQTALGIEVYGSLYYGLEVALLFMAACTLWVSLKEIMGFSLKIQIQSLFFRLYRAFPDSPEKGLIQTAIDQGDWSTAKEIIDEFIRRKWTSAL